jgi:trimeric autotransporter adhesin
MKKIFLLLALVLVLTTGANYGQAVGDYGTGQAAVSWNTANQWVVCVTLGTWDGATTATLTPSASTNCWIRSGHTATLPASGNLLCYNLTVDNGGSLVSLNNALTPRYLRVYGPTITVNGSFGGSNDGLSLYFINSATGTTTLSGTPSTTFYICRVQPQIAQSIIFDVDCTITYAGSGGAGSSGIYCNSFATTFTINAGRTVTMVNGSYITIATSGTADPAPANAVDWTINIMGTLTTQTGSNTSSINLGNNAKTTTFHVYPTGVVNCGNSMLAPSTGLATAVNVTVDAGGIVSFTGASGSGTCDISKATTTMNGTWDYNNIGTATRSLGATASVGSTGLIRSKDAVLATAGALTLNAGSTVEYYGTSPITGVTVTPFDNLKINNSGGVTLGGPVTVTGTLTLTNGTFTVGANTLTLQNPIAGTPGNLTAGSTSSIAIGGLVSGINIPSNVTALNNLTLNNSNGTQLQGPISLAGTLTLASGALTNGSNLTLGPSATISRSGGSLDAVPTFGTSVNVNYLENGTQITTGPELPTSTTVLNNLTINSTHGVLLNAPVTAKGVFTLTLGTIKTTPTTLLTFTEGATVGLGQVDGSSFVDGPMAYVLTTAQAYTKNYPIGKGGIWRPLVLSLNQTDATSSIYTAEMFNFAPVPNTVPGTLSWVSGIRYYTISENVSGSAFNAGALEIIWGPDDKVSDFTHIRIAQGSAVGGDIWVDMGGTPSGGATTIVGNVTSTIAFTDLINTIFVLANATGGMNDLPVELSSFTVASSKGAIVLSWKTAVETKNHGFDVERSADNKTWTKLTFIQGHGNSNSPENYSYTDNTVGKAGKYYYRLKQLDNDGGYKYSSVAETEFVVPDVYSLSQNYPNPFNPSTKINYCLPSDSRVTLDIYNILGVKVGQLVNQDQAAGYYSVAFSTSSLNKSITSGVYLYKITAVDKATGNSFSAIKKMMMLK